MDVNDIGFVLEACAAIRVPDAERTRVLRRRYLAIIVDGFATPTGTLPGPPPAEAETNWRWRRR
ncbi:MAG: hypothetical protein HOV67_00980 [Kribbellaceae bacterium]|nr:hypothetical protein [Kribbellaceae bacterium]